MAYPNIRKSYRGENMSAAEATVLVRKMVAREMRGSSDTGPAMNRLETLYGLPFWTLDHLRRGKAKTCDVKLFAWIRGAYLAHCETELRTLRHEIELEQMRRDDDLDADLLAEAEALLAKIRQRRKG